MSKKNQFLNPRLWLSISVLATCYPAFSQVTPAVKREDPPECKVMPQPAEEVIPSDSVSGDYWTNMMGNDIVMFTNTGGTSGRFQAFDLKHKVPVRLTTRIDPFPAPDGRHLYIHPSPIRFYHYDDVKNRIEKGASPDVLSDRSYSYGNGVKENVNPANPARFVDSDNRIGGYYESLGSLEKVKTAGDNHSTYRVLTGEGEGAIKDYKVTFGPNDEILNVEAKSEAIRLCPNMRDRNNDLDFDTPIISPKGDEFAVTNRRTRSTVVMKFDPKTGACTKTLDLGFSTGKVHFSPDGSQIAFHSTSISRVSTPKPYLYDRKTGTLKSLEVGDPNDGAQGTFPTFRPDGKIVYQRVKLNRATGSATKDWVVVDPKKFRSVSMKALAADAAACGPVKIDSGVQKLRDLWESACVDAARKANGMLWVLTVDPKACVNFVNKTTLASNAAVTDARAPIVPIDEAEKQILLAACSKKVILPSPRAAKFTSHGVAQTYPRLLESRCAVCHVQGSPHGYIPFDNPEAMRAMKAIGSSAGPGQPFEGKSFLDQVQGILKENVRGHTPAAGIPVVPADGERLNQGEVNEIVDWVKDGKKGKYVPPPSSARNNYSYGSSNQGSSSYSTQPQQQQPPQYQPQQQQPSQYQPQQQQPSQYPQGGMGMSGSGMSGSIPPAPTGSTQTSH